MGEAGSLEEVVVAAVAPAAKAWLKHARLVDMLAAFAAMQVVV